MSQKEIVTVLKVNTENSGNNIKSLKQEIAQLKKALESAEIGSEEFAQASRDLAAAQANLKTILADGKKANDALEGSYNHMVATMAELKKAWRATADEAKRAEIGKQIDEINTKLKAMDATIGNHQRNVGNYTDSIVEAYEEISGSADKAKHSVDGLSSAPAPNAQPVYDYGKAWSEVQKGTEQTRAKFESIQKMASGVASGFAALQGVTALLGGENENLQKTLVKVQAAMAIAQGIGGLKDLIEGFSQAKVAFKGATMGLKVFGTESVATAGAMQGVTVATNTATVATNTFKKALISTGIGALIVLIGTLISKAGDMFAFFDGGASRADNLESKINDVRDAWSDLFDELNENERWMRLEGKSDSQIIAANWKQAKAEYDKNVADYNKALAAYKDDMYTWYGAWREDEYNRLNEWYSELGEQRDALNQMHRDHQYALAVEQKEAQEQQLEQERQAQEERERQQQEAYDRALEQQKAYQEKQQELLNEAVGIAERARQSNIDTQEEELAELDRVYAIELAKLQKFGIDTANLTEENERKRSEIIEKYAKKNEELVKQERETLLRILNENLSTYDSFNSDRVQGIQNKYTNMALDTPDMTEIDSINQEIALVGELDKAWEQMYTNKIRLIDEAINSAILDGEQTTQLFLERDRLESEWLLKKEESNIKVKQLTQELYDAEKEKQRQLASNITATFTSTLNGVSQILSEIQSGIDTRNEEGFEKSKKLQIAMATINMLGGITAALAGAYTTKTGPWDWVLAGIQAATIATAGGIQIANISKQTYDGSNSGNVGNLNGGVGVSPNISMADMIPINYTKEVLSDTETAELNKGNKVYVVESDITETQNDVAVKETNSSF